MAPPSQRPANQYDNQWLLCAYADKTQRFKTKPKRPATKEVPKEVREQKRKKYETWRAGLQKKTAEASKAESSTAKASIRPEETNDKADKQPHGKHTPEAPREKNLGTKSAKSRKSNNKEGSTLQITSASSSQVQAVSPTAPSTSSGPVAVAISKQLSAGRDIQDSESKLNVIPALDGTATQNSHYSFDSSQSDNHSLLRSLVRSVKRSRGSTRTPRMESSRHSITSLRRKRPRPSSQEGRKNSVLVKTSSGAPNQVSRPLQSAVHKGQSKSSPDPAPPGLNSDTSQRRLSNKPNADAIPGNSRSGAAVEIKNEVQNRNMSQAQLASGPGSHNTNAIDLTLDPDDDLDSGASFDFSGSAALPAGTVHSGDIALPTRHKNDVENDSPPSTGHTIAKSKGVELGGPVPKRTRINGQNERDVIQAGNAAMNDSPKPRAQQRVFWQNDSDSEDSIHQHGVSHGLYNDVERTQKRNRSLHNAGRGLNELGIGEALGKRTRKDDVERELELPVIEHSTEIPNPRIRPVTGSELIPQVPDRADGLGNIEYYPHFPGSKTSNRNLFRSKEASRFHETESPPTKATTSSHNKPKANEISVTGWEIAKAVIPEDCFSVVNRAQERTGPTEDPALFVQQCEEQTNGASREAFQEMEMARKKTEYAKAKQKTNDEELPRMGLSEDSEARFRRKFEMEAEDLEERRILKARREGEGANGQRKLSGRRQRERRDNERQGNESDISQVSTEQQQTKTIREPPNFAIFAHVRPPTGSAADLMTLQKRAEALYGWRQAGLKWTEIERNWYQMTGNVKKSHALGEYYGRLMESIDYQESTKTTSCVQQAPTSPMAPPNLHVKPKKRVRIDDIPRIREHDTGKDTNKTRCELVEGPSTLKPAREPNLSSVDGGKNMELVEKLYRERQRSDSEIDNESGSESDSEEVAPEVAEARQASPITDADFTYWAYSVKRKAWEDSEEEKDVPWTQCGDVYDSLHEAEMAAGKEILQQRDCPFPLFPDPDEFRIFKDANGLKNYSVIAHGYNVNVRVGRILRTTKDEIAPRSKAGWLPKIIYEIKYETGEESAEGQSEVKSVPELFTIREQANREAAGKLVDLSVEAESHRIDDVHKRIQARKQVDEYLVALEEERGLFEAEGDDGTGVKVWVLERAINGPRNA